MTTREPVVAGQFYPAEPETCLTQIQQCLQAVELPPELPASITAGIVPHAGWTFSGATAAAVFAAVKARHDRVDTFVICGTAHSYFGAGPVADDCDAWSTPLGDVILDRDLSARLRERGVLDDDGSAHRREHSIEVQAPFIRHLFPEARLLPIVTPPRHSALLLGEALAETISKTDEKIVCLGSTDLTHYGPRYGFTPMGQGTAGLRWACEVNDRQFIELAVKVDAERVLADAIDRGSACGPGAAASAVMAAKKQGCPGGLLLKYTNSNEIIQLQTGTTSRDSVGYAAIVF